MQGKTLDEIAEFTQNLYTDFTRIASASPPPPATSAAPEPSMSQTSPPDHNLIYTNPAEYQRQLIAYQQSQWGQQVGAIAAPFAARLAESDRAASRNGQYREVWQKWEPEIERKLAGIPAENRTLALYDQAAALVRADHIDEIAQERAEQIAATTGSGTERAGGNASLQFSSAADKLDEVYDSEHPFFANAREQRVTKEMIRDHCRQMKIPVDQYVANATLGTVVIAKNGFERRSA